MPIANSDDGAADKEPLRARVRASRAARPASAQAADRRALAATVAQWCVDQLPQAAVIAGYVPLASEPMPTELLNQLTDLGHRIIVPITLADNDLDWRAWNSDRILGRDAIGSAALVLTPAFAVDPFGRRLGRGGGSYDRALARAAPTAVIAAVLYDDELVDEVPTASWDIAVTGVFSPSGFGVRPVDGVP